MPTTDFYSTTIAGITFTGCISADGPYINADHNYIARGVALGHCCSITHCDADEYGPNGWYICKYSNQKRVFLDGFTDADVQALSDAFHIHVDTFPLHSERTRPDFINSRAWNGLVDWVSKHPVIAKRSAKFCAYISNWYAAAIAELQIKASRA